MQKAWNAETNIIRGLTVSFVYETTTPFALGPYMSQRQGRENALVLLIFITNTSATMPLKRCYMLDALSYG